MIFFSYSTPHSSFSFFIHEVNFTFSPSIAPTPNSYYCSSLHPLKVISLSVGQPISTIFSYNSLNLIIPLLILVHLLLIVGLLRESYICGFGFVLGLCGFIQAASAQQHTRCGVQRDPSVKQ